MLETALYKVAEGQGMVDKLAKPHRSDPVAEIPAKHDDDQRIEVPDQFEDDQWIEVPEDDKSWLQDYDPEVGVARLTKRAKPITDRGVNFVGLRYSCGGGVMAVCVWRGGDCVCCACGFCSLNDVVVTRTIAGLYLRL